MKLPARNMPRLLVFGLAVGALAVAPAWCQPQSTNWGWYTPPPATKPAPPPAKKPAGPAPATKTVTEGGDVSGNRPPLTATTSSSGGSGGGVQTQQVSVPGINGGSRNVVDQETETTQLNASTTRTVTKIYGQDTDGNRELIGVNRTDTTDLGNGKSQSVTRQSQLDANGQMDVTRQVESETVPSGAHSSTTNTTVLTPGPDGGMSASQKIQEIQQTGDKTKQTTSTLMTPNGNGGWTTTQKTQTVVHDQGNGQQTEDQKVYAIDANGNLTVAQQVVTRDWKDKTGQDHQEMSTYVMTPGGNSSAQGGGLSLAQRVSTVKTTQPDGTVKTVQQTEQASPVSMSEGLKVTGEVVDVSTPTQSGGMETRQTVRTDDGNGQLQQVSAFSGQSPMPTQGSKAKTNAPAKPNVTKEVKPPAKAAKPKP